MISSGMLFGCQESGEFSGIRFIRDAKEFSLICYFFLTLSRSSMLYDLGVSSGFSPNYSVWASGGG